MLKLKPGLNGVRIRETPGNGKPIGQIYAGDILESQEDGETMSQKLGKPGEWLRIKAPNGIVAYVAAWLLAEVEALPQPLPRQETEGKLHVRVKPTINGLRLRELPVDGKPIGLLNIEMALVALEAPDSAREKIGVSGQWLRVRTPEGITGYTAAWLLAYHDEIHIAPPVKSSRITGMNLDIRHPLGAPEAERLDGLGWVRMAYNVSAGRGSEDINAAYDRYRPAIERYAHAGLKVLLVFTHQTYGEGKDEFWPWPSMTTDKWHRLSNRLAEMVKQIVAQYAGEDLVQAYQVWNEQDARIGAVASVPMPASDYAIILGNLIQATRSSDPGTTVITGGHTGGPEPGAAYARATLAALPDDIKPDGVAFHPYGRGLDGQRYAVFGHIQDSMAAYTAVLPDKPVWITEWGVLDRPYDPAEQVLDYAKSVTHYLSQHYPDKVAALIWYAWAMGMHNGYGLVNRDNQPIQPLYDEFRKL